MWKIPELTTPVVLVEKLDPVEITFPTKHTNNVTLRRRGVYSLLFIIGTRVKRVKEFLLSLRFCAVLSTCRRFATA